MLYLHHYLFISLFTIYRALLIVNEKVLCQPLPPLAVFQRELQGTHDNRLFALSEVLFKML